MMAARPNIGVVTPFDDTGPGRPTCGGDMVVHNAESKQRYSETIPVRHIDISGYDELSNIALGDQPYLQNVNTLDNAQYGT